MKNYRELVIITVFMTSVFGVTLLLNIFGPKGHDLISFVAGLSWIPAIAILPFISGYLFKQKTQINISKEIIRYGIWMNFPLVILILVFEFFRGYKNCFACFAEEYLVLSPIIITFYFIMISSFYIGAKINVSGK